MTGKLLNPKAVLGALCPSILTMLLQQTYPTYLHTPDTGGMIQS